MKALLLAFLTLLMNSAVPAISFDPPPTDTGIKLRIKEIKPYPKRANLDLVTVEITNAAKVDYWVRRRKELEKDLLFSEANPKNYAYFVVDDHRQVFRKAGKWEGLDLYHMEIGELLEKLEPGKSLVFQIPIDKMVFEDSKAIKVLLFFARDPDAPSSGFRLFTEPEEEKAQQVVPPNGP
jgi:hypothetical protein